MKIQTFSEWISDFGLTFQSCCSNHALCQMRDEMVGKQFTRQEFILVLTAILWDHK